MESPMIRTTVYLPANLVQLAKSTAFKTGKTLTGLMKESLEAKLKVKKVSKKKFAWKTYKLGIGVFDRSMAYENRI